MKTLNQTNGSNKSVHQLMDEAMTSEQWRREVKSNI